MKLCTEQTGFFSVYLFLEYVMKAPAEEHGVFRETA